MEARSRVRMAREGRRERNKAEMLARIKRAARALFSRRGVEATTIRDIAEAADIGLGTMFSYAANKQELLVMIFLDEVDPAVDRALAAVPERPLLDQVTHVLGSIVAHHQDNPALARVFVKETPFIDGRRYGLAGFMAKLLAGMEHLIERAKERGELERGVPAATLARNLFGLFFQQLQIWLGAPNPRPRFDYGRLRESLELQLCGLRRTGRRGPGDPDAPGKDESRRRAGKSARGRRRTHAVSRV